jgi:hypothetical protein
MSRFSPLSLRLPARGASRGADSMAFDVMCAETMEIIAEERVSAHPMVINGELVQSSAGLSDPVVNPATGEVFDYVPHGTREDLDRAVDAAAEAFKTWGTTPFPERAACMLKFAELVDAKKEELAKAMTMEQGKPFASSMGEVMGLIGKCHESANPELELTSETVSEDDDAEYKVVYSPRGVIGGITPWNVSTSTSTQAQQHARATRFAACLSLRVPPPPTVPLAIRVVRIVPAACFAPVYTAVRLTRATLPAVPAADGGEQAAAVRLHRQHRCGQAEPVHPARHLHALRDGRRGLPGWRHEHHDRRR